jgi:hypothetical protein
MNKNKNKNKTRKRSGGNNNDFVNAIDNNNYPEVFLDEELNTPNKPKSIRPIRQLPLLEAIDPKLAIAVNPKMRHAKKTNKPFIESPVEQPIPQEPVSNISKFSNTLESYAMRLPLIQHFSLYLIKHITDSLYSFNTLEDVYNYLPKFINGTPSEGIGQYFRRLGQNPRNFKMENLLNIMRFYIKGGTATKLLNEASVYGSSRHSFPFSIDSDIDCQLVINPNIPINIFNILRFKYFETVINTIFRYFISATTDERVYNYFMEINRELERHKDHFGNLDVKKKKVEVFFNDISTNSPEIYTLLTNIHNKYIPDVCPFNLRIYQNYGYIGPRGFTALNFSLIKIYIPIPNSRNIIELIDISIPNFMNDKKLKDWKLSDDLLKMEYGLVQHPVSHYINQVLTDITMSPITPTNKAKYRKTIRRKERIEKIKERIYKPHKLQLKPYLNKILKNESGFGRNAPTIKEILKGLD